MPWDNLFLIVPPYLPRAPAVWGLQELLLAKLSQLCKCRLYEHRRAAPKSTGALAREFIICPRFHCEAACQSRFRDNVHRSGQSHLRAASHVAGPFDPRGQLTPAPCIQLLYIPILRPFFQRSFLSNNIIHRLFTIRGRIKIPPRGLLGILVLYSTRG